MKGSRNSDHISSTSHDIVPYKDHNESDDEPSGYTPDFSTVTLLIILIYLIRDDHQNMDTYNSISSSSTITMDGDGENDDKHSGSELSR